MSQGWTKNWQKARLYVRVINTVAEDKFATKQDLLDLKHELLAEIHALEKRFDALEKGFIGLKNNIDTLIMKMTIRLGSITIAGVAILTAIIKL